MKITLCLKVRVPHVPCTALSERQAKKDHFETCREMHPGTSNLRHVLGKSWDPYINPIYSP